MLCAPSQLWHLFHSLQDELTRAQGELKRLLRDRQAQQEKLQLLLAELRGELLAKTRELEELRLQVVFFFFCIISCSFTYSDHMFSLLLHEQKYRCALVLLFNQTVCVCVRRL